ncbi:MAG: purine permease, partial [Atopostipes suicloacalis]|nr:purine permease [Atopostipes suicloacalis]
MKEIGQRDREAMIEEKLPLSRNLLLALQHLLLMNAYVVPIIIASMLDFSSEGASTIIQSTFLASGITTLIQAKFFMKYPVVYGASFVPIGAIAGIYAINGGDSEAWSVVLGACLVGAISVLILGFSKQFKKILDSLVPPVVGATVVLCIGLSLIPLALDSQIFVENGFTIGQNVIISITTIVAMILFSFLGNKKGKFASIAQIGSGIFALLVGYLLANMLGEIDLTAVKDASLISRPALPF